MLKERSEEVLNAINEAWKPEDDSRMGPAVNRFTKCDSTPDDTGLQMLITSQ